MNTWERPRSDEENRPISTTTKEVMIGHKKPREQRVWFPNFAAFSTKNFSFYNILNLHKWVCGMLKTHGTIAGRRVPVHDLPIQQERIRHNIYAQI